MSMETFFEAPLIIQVHATSATGALVAGLLLLTVKRGRLLHRTFGITCAALVSITAVTAAFIMGAGHWSWIHAFIPLTVMGIIGVTRGVLNRNWISHRNAGRGLIFGALLIPGLFTLMPGRLMHAVVFGS